MRSLLGPLWRWWDGGMEPSPRNNPFAYIDDLSPDEVRSRQLEGLRSILRHAAGHVPYYSELFRARGLEPDSIRCAAELGALPLLTKEVIRENFDALQASGIPESDRLPDSTGGATGVPLRFYRDRECFRRRVAQERYFDRWLGWSMGEPLALFVTHSHHESTSGRIKARIRNATYTRMISYDPHETDEEYLEAFAREFARFRPVLIKCFPNSLAVFADFVRRRGRQLPPVRAISCAGENLYPRQRRLFEETFGGPVFEKYGTRDAGVIACECPSHDGLHVFTEGAVVEVLRPDGSAAAAGESGRVVVTDLFNRAMPLIRYDIGDMAIPADDAPCGCGSPLPRLRQILGRDRDIVIDAEGRPRVGYLFVETVKDLHAEAQFQIVQPDRERLIVRVAEPRPGADVLQRITREFEGIVGPGMQISVEFVDEIPRDPSGKYRYVVSELTRWDAPEA